MKRSAQEVKYTDMTFIEFIKAAEKQGKLFALYWSRIVFARNHFHTSLLTKIQANLSGGFLADQWILYELDRKKRKDYLSEFDWYRSRYIDEPYDYMLNNKVIATEVFGQYIRMPKIYLIKSKGIVFDYDNNILNTDQALEYIQGKGDVVLKPFSKGQGNGVHRITFDADGFALDGTPTGKEPIRKKLDRWENWYLTETIVQHPYAAALYDQTVNTIRIITLRAPQDGKIKVFFAVQRVGTSHTLPVDNASQGGLVCKVDLSSGRLSQARSLHEQTVYERHPDSGVRFEDVVIPDWQGMKDEILALANRFPYLSFVAWDVVKLPDGKNCVIEANASSGVNIIQLWGGQRNGELGNFYRYHHVIR